ncbi:Abi-like protein [Mycolicibacterium mucogenicum 261Sha1.1M5]|nr:Abi-like protein [Mycolicibacterium mucogenicum 261Sha1.1M5]
MHMVEAMSICHNVRVHIDSSKAERWLSRPRLAAYLSRAGGDHNEALKLYEWNAEVSSACLRDVGHFEVLIRNRYSDRLTDYFTDWTSSSSQLWQMENGIPQTRAKQRYANKKSRAALNIALNKAPTPSPGQIIANLTFGFWSQLTLPVRESTIWTPAISADFEDSSRGSVHDPMAKLNKFRNRLAHWEPIFSSTTGLTARLQEFERIFETVDPDVAAWVGCRSNVIEVLEQCPLSNIGINVSAYFGKVPAFQEP